jgi:hypothetical protein
MYEEKPLVSRPAQVPVTGFSPFGLSLAACARLCWMPFVSSGSSMSRMRPRVSDLQVPT